MHRGLHAADAVQGRAQDGAEDRLAGAPAASECSALVFLTEGDSAEVVIVRESAVVGSDEPEGVPDQIGRHPLFELCKVVRGDSDQYLRLEFEGGSAYVLLTRDEAISTEILEHPKCPPQCAAIKLLLKLLILFAHYAFFGIFFRFSGQRPKAAVRKT